MTFAGGGVPLVEPYDAVVWLPMAYTAAFKVASVFMPVAQFQLVAPQLSKAWMPTLVKPFLSKVGRNVLFSQLVLSPFSFRHPM
jgi:hypothetical protein